MTLLTVTSRVVEARAEMPLHLCALLFGRVQQALQKVHHQNCMVRELLISGEIVDVHNQKVGTFTTCKQHMQCRCMLMEVTDIAYEQGPRAHAAEHDGIMCSVLLGAAADACACKERLCSADVTHFDIK